MKKLAAEFVGTFALVFAGTGAIAVDESSAGAVTHVGVALTFGLIVLAMIYTVGDISGAHLNPAVSLGFFVAGRFPFRNVMPYIASQCIGALTASSILRALFPQNATLGATIPAGSEIQSFILELILTAVLMFVILCVSSGAAEKGITAGIVVGSVIGLEAMFAGPICGASMNPSRSLAPAIISGHLEHLWIYCVAPVIGAFIGVLGCRCVRESGCCSKNAESTPIRPPTRIMVLIAVRQLTLAVILITALFTGAARLPATVCPVASAPMGKACQMGCCASKCCCVDSQKNHNLPSIPAAKDSSSNHELVAIVAPTLITLKFSVRPVDVRPNSSVPNLPDSVPRPALLCTFLI